jgi:hypothetical protein
MEGGGCGRGFWVYNGWQMSLKNYTTEVDAGKTVGEIQAILAKHGITSIQIEYDEGVARGIKFAAFLLGQPQWFHLDCNADAVLGTLQSQKVPPKYQTRDQAFRVGWRIMKDLVDAQLAAVSIKQVELAQAFFGFAVDGRGENAFQIYKEQKQKQLTAGVS